MFYLLMIRFEREKIAASWFTEGLERCHCVASSVEAKRRVLTMNRAKAIAVGQGWQFRTGHRANRLVIVGPRHHKGLRQGSKTDRPKAKGLLALPMPNAGVWMHHDRMAGSWAGWRWRGGRKGGHWI